MSDGGKPTTGKAKKRKARAAAAKPKPTETAAPGAADRPDPATDEPAAPVGFTSRDTAGEAKPESTAKSRRGAGAAVALVAAVAVIAVAGYLTRATWLPRLHGGGKPAAVAGKATDKPVAVNTADAQGSAPAPAGDGGGLESMIKEREQLRAEIDRLIARLDGVEKSMDTAKKMIRATEPTEEKIAGATTLQQLSERVGALEKNEAAIKDLRTRVEKMEKSGDGDARAVVLAVTGLSDAIARGEPYQRHLEALKAVAAGDPSIKAAAALIAKGAGSGIPTLTQLRDRFDALAGRIVHASKAGDDGGWMARAANRISSLITWRRVGDGGGDSVDAMVARAEAHLKTGDLAGAVKALDGLASHRKAADAAEAWLADAKARVIAERAVASLHVHAVSLLAPAKP